jgi:hypothetical protein
MNLADQLDGAFLTVPAYAVRQWDVLCRPARQIVSVSRDREMINILTVVGAEMREPGDDVEIFRPNDPAVTVADECFACGAMPGEPCSVTVCRSLTEIDDAANELAAIQKANAVDGLAR